MESPGLDITRENIILRIGKGLLDDKGLKEARWLCSKISFRYQKGLSDSFWERLDKFKKKYLAQSN